MPAKDARQAGASGLLAAQKGALALTGSWLVHWSVRSSKFESWVRTRSRKGLLAARV